MCIYVICKRFIDMYCELFWILALKLLYSSTKLCFICHMTISVEYMLNGINCWLYVCMLQILSQCKSKYIVLQIFFPMLFLHWFIHGCNSAIGKLDDLNSPTHMHSCWPHNLFQYWLGFIMFNENVPNFIKIITFWIQKCNSHINVSPICFFILSFSCWGTSCHFLQIDDCKQL